MAKMPGMHGLFYPHTQESPGQSLSPAHFLQLYPVGQDWATATACCPSGDGNTHFIRKMGGSWWGRFGCDGLSFAPGLLTGKFLQERVKQASTKTN